MRGKQMSMTIDGAAHLKNNISGFRILLTDFKRLSFIRKILARKISIYDPLNLKSVYKSFLHWLKEGEYKAIRILPTEQKEEDYLNQLVKDFLIRNAYFVLEKKCIMYRLMRELNISNTNDVRLLEIVDFISERIERDELGRLRKFEEKCKFKTYFSLVVTRLLMDYWREKYKIIKHITKYEPEYSDFLEKAQPGPLERLLEKQDETIKKRAGIYLPLILESLDFKEKLVIRLKYEQDLNVSEIARTLGVSRYKADQYTREIEMSISKKMATYLKDGGINGENNTLK